MRIWFACREVTRWLQDGEAREENSACPICDHPLGAWEWPAVDKGPEHCFWSLTDLLCSAVLPLVLGHQLRCCEGEMKCVCRLFANSRLL